MFQQEYIIYLMVFLCGFMALQVFMSLGKQATVKVIAANDRMRRLEEENASQATLLQQMRKERALNLESGILGTIHNVINRLVVQSGLKIGPDGIYKIMALLAIIGMVATYIIKQSFAYAVLGAFSGLILPLTCIKFLATRRRKKLSRQLPEAIDIIVRSLKAGHPVPVAIALVGREMPDPIGSEFGMASDEIAFGSQLTAAIGRLSERVGDPDVDLFAAMIRLQQRTGGNLTELLNNNANTIRARQKMRLKIKAATAEGRMSALILNMAPIAIFGLVNILSPNFYGDVEGHPALRNTFIGAGIWLMIGNLVMKKMINFKI